MRPIEGTASRETDGPFLSAWRKAIGVPPAPKDEKIARALAVHIFAGGMWKKFRSVSINRQGPGGNENRTAAQSGAAVPLSKGGQKPTLPAP